MGILYECDRCKKTQRTSLAHISIPQEALDDSAIYRQHLNLRAESDICTTCFNALNSWWKTIPPEAM